MTAQVLVRLARLTAEPEWERCAEEQLAFLAGCSLGLLAMGEMSYPAGEVVCCSAEGSVPQGFFGYDGGVTCVCGYEVSWDHEGTCTCSSVYFGVSDSRNGSGVLLLPSGVVRELSELMRWG